MLSSTLVVIPALNEEATLGSVISAVRSHLKADVLVVDDGSVDRTAPVARANGAHVLQHPFNLGVGAAMRSGFRFAAERGYNAVVQVDADGQHDPAEAVHLLFRLRDEELDLVIGSRFDSGYRVGRGRRAVMRLLSREVSRRLGVRISDTTSGFRAFGPRTIDRFARAYPSAYLSDTVEALLLAGDWKLRVAEEPVVMHPRAGGRPSSGSVKSFLYLIRLVLVIALHRVRRPIAERGLPGDVEA